MAAGLFKRGVLVAGTLTSAQTIRIEPPLIIRYEQIDAVLDRLEDVLMDVSQELLTYQKPECEPMTRYAVELRDVVKKFPKSEAEARSMRSTTQHCRSSMASSSRCWDRRAAERPPRCE